MRNGMVLSSFRSLGLLFLFLLVGCAVNKNISVIRESVDSGELEVAYYNAIEAKQLFPANKELISLADSVANLLYLDRQNKVKALNARGNYHDGLKYAIDTELYYRNSINQGLSIIEYDQHALKEAFELHQTWNLELARHLNEDQLEQHKLRFVDLIKKTRQQLKHLGYENETKRQGFQLDSIILNRRITHFIELGVPKSFCEAIDFGLEWTLNKESSTAVKFASFTNSCIGELESHIKYFWANQEYQNVVFMYQQRYFPVINTIGVSLNLSMDPSIQELYQKSLEIHNHGLADSLFNLAVNKSTENKHLGAFHLYNKTDSIIPNFRSCRDSALTSLERAKITIGFLGIADNLNCGGLGSILAKYVQTTSFSDQKLFSIVDRSQIVDVLQEQALWMSGAMDQTSIGKIGNIAGAKWLLVGKVESCLSEPKLAPYQTIPAYNVIAQTSSEPRYSTSYNYLTKQNETKTCQVSVVRYNGSHANVTMFSGTKSLTAIISLRLIDVETSKLLYADQFKQTVTDNVFFADCGGCNYLQLYSSMPSDVVPSGCDMGSALGSLFSSIANAIVASRKPPLNDSLFQTRKIFYSDSEMLEPIKDNLGKRVQSSLKTIAEDYYKRIN